MRTICKTERDQTYFLITGLEPAYEQVLQGLLACPLRVVNESKEHWGVSDAGPTAASNLETIVWQGVDIRVPLLDMQLAVSQPRGLTGRVEKIKRFAKL